MSRIKIVNPVIHTPSFETFEIDGATLKGRLSNIGLTTPMGMLDGRYYYTTAEGWGKLLVDLMVKSDLWTSDKYDCDDYAMKARMTCIERYGLNAIAFVIGDIAEGRHAFCLIYTGEDWLIFEPNIGFGLGGQAFPIGAEGYVPDMVLV